MLSLEHKIWQKLLSAQRKRLCHEVASKSMSPSNDPSLPIRKPALGQNYVRALYEVFIEEHLDPGAHTRTAINIQTSICLNVRLHQPGPRKLNYGGIGNSAPRAKPELRTLPGRVPPGQPWLNRDSALERSETARLPVQVEPMWVPAASARSTAAE